MLKFLQEVVYFTKESYMLAYNNRVSLAKYLANYPRMLAKYLVLTYFGSHTTIVRKAPAQPYVNRKYYKR